MRPFQVGVQFQTPFADSLQMSAASDTAYVFARKREESGNTSSHAACSYY
jgi:hypothetical protein